MAGSDTSMKSIASYSVSLKANRMIINAMPQPSDPLTRREPGSTKHLLPPLPYDYAALEPSIDVRTMRLHHDKHHASYVANLNTALESVPELHERSALWLLLNLSEVLVNTSCHFPRTETTATSDSLKPCDLLFLLERDPRNLAVT